MPAPAGRGLYGRSWRGGSSTLDGLVEPVAELGNRIAEGEDAGGDGAAREVQGVAVGVEVAVKGCGLLATQRQGHGEQVEASFARRLRGGGPCTAGRAGGRFFGLRGGVDQEIAERDAVRAEGGEIEGLPGKLEFPGPVELG